MHGHYIFLNNSYRKRYFVGPGIRGLDPQRKPWELVLTTIKPFTVLLQSLLHNKCVNCGSHIRIEYLIFICDLMNMVLYH